uniref:Uncharacterized protein n=1 Tax=Solanum tuberosum TaxID=4113 RepID=M1E0U4_SOLTU
MYPDGSEKIHFQWTQNSIASPEQTLFVVLLAVATASPELLLLRLRWSCCFGVLPGIASRSCRCLSLVLAVASPVALAWMLLLLVVVSRWRGESEGRERGEMEGEMREKGDGEGRRRGERRRCLVLAGCYF